MSQDNPTTDWRDRDPRCECPLPYRAMKPEVHHESCPVVRDQFSQPTTDRFTGWSVDKLLDMLPLLCTCVSDKKRLGNASDAELQAWVWGIEGAAEQVQQIITRWRAANA